MSTNGGQDIISDQEISDLIRDNDEAGDTHSLSRWRFSLIVAGVVIVVLSVAANLALGVILINSNNRHHAETMAQNRAIEQALGVGSGELSAIKDLSASNRKIISQLPAADAVLYFEVAYLNQCIYHLSQGTGTACIAPPNLKGP